MAVAELGGKIYVLGGYPANRVTVTTVQVYDVATDSWTLGPPLPGPVNHTTAVSANGKLYVLGGQSSAAGGGPFVDSVFELDPALGEWVLKAPMPRARGGGAAAVVDGLIYMVGGRPPHGQDFAVYDPTADTWTVLPDLPTGRNHIAAGAIEGKIYVVGGRFGSGFSSDMTDLVEVFDPAASSWSTEAPMPTIRGGINAAVMNGCLHIFGGEGANGMFNQHEVYDPVTDTWLSLPPMATAVHGVTGSAVIGEWIYLPGGGTAVGGSSGSTIHQLVRTEIVCS
jgi:N-acetylneuraminic acid mutarotase